MQSFTGQFVMMPKEEYQAIVDMTNKVDKILKEITSKTFSHPFTEDNPWLTAPQFCNKYSIGRSTLVRKVKEGKVEILDQEEHIKKYRRAI